MSFPPHDHAARRERAFARLGERAALVLPAAPEITIGRDTDVSYVVDANVHYLTGITDPETVVVLANTGETRRFVLFLRERDAERERWTGPREAPAAIGERVGADAVFSIRDLRERLPKMLAGADTIHLPLAWGRADVERAVLDLVGAGRRSRQRMGRGPRTIADPGAILDEMRLRKDEAEIARMRAAARVTVDAFAETSAAVQGAGGEAQVQAALEYNFRRRGATGIAFPSIVAGGENATVLHYTRNDARLNPSDMILIDAGATVDFYHADVTRTWSLSPRPSQAQRDAHAVVLNAHRAALAAVRPGATEAAVHRAALAELLRGMEGLGLLDEKADAALAAEEERLGARPSEAEPDGTSTPKRPGWTRYFPHRVSHWLGLEVHDVGDYAVDGESRRLEPGMVLTIEPGLYIPPDDERAPAALRGVGIRIEDDVLVVPDGADVLSRGLPTGPALP